MQIEAMSEAEAIIGESPTEHPKEKAVCWMDVTPAFDHHDDVVMDPQSLIAEAK